VPKREFYELKGHLGAGGKDNKVAFGKDIKQRRSGNYGGRTLLNG
jgi:hypothetical protein